MSPEQFSTAILEWYQQHGRKSLPWQLDATPYHVWVSEVMLQQTQVSTVLDYYQRFIQRFPSIECLAKAELDEVLHLWTGLGYYSRARNLHKTAKIVHSNHANQFPRSVAELEQLPGIGRSTAGAIASLGMGIHAPILDGNVKRVLARFSAEPEYPGTSAANKRLWLLAEQFTPQEHVGAYNQAMMDMGALLCTRSRPNCVSCPIQSGCQAFALRQQQSIPVPRPKKELPVKRTHMLLICTAERKVLLTQRPPQGLWGGLYVLPEVENAAEIPHFLLSQQLITSAPQPLAQLSHKFSHFELQIQPWLIHIQTEPSALAESGLVWYNTQQPQALGLAAPIKKLLDRHLANVK